MAVETVRIEGLEPVLKTLRELGPAAGQRGGPVRLALRKAAVLVQKQVIANLNAVILEPNEGDLPSKSTGLLAANIAITRSKPAPGTKGERMLVRVRRKAYPKSGKKTVTTPQVARLLEYGTAKMRPHPFIRPAFDSTKQQALTTFATELPKALLALQKRIAKKNGAKD